MYMDKIGQSHHLAPLLIGLQQVSCPWWPRHHLILFIQTKWSFQDLLQPIPFVQHFQLQYLPIEKIFQRRLLQWLRLSLRWFTFLWTPTPVCKEISLQCVFGIYSFGVLLAKKLYWNVKFVVCLARHIECVFEKKWIVWYACHH